MEYLVISFTHKNTDITTREKLAFKNELELTQALKNLIKSDFINEIVIVSTCNRVELIANCSNLGKTITVFLQFLSQKSNISFSELENIADIYEQENAIHHIFMVASSLDSLVVGETQIVGQLKEAFIFAKENGFAGKKLSRVFDFAFKCAAAVRNQTNLGGGSTSVASAAVMQAVDLFGKNSFIEAVVIGAGKMSELAARHLLKHNFKVIICSRNYEKANLLVNSIIEDGNGNSYSNDDVKALNYDNLVELLNSKKLLISATSAPYPIIKKEMVKEVSFKRVWFDIAIPRDIEEININDLKIFRVDDLQCIVDKNLKVRAEIAKKAINIVNEKVKEFYNWINSLQVEPIIKKLHLKGYKIVEEKINKAIKKGYIKKDEKENIKKLSINIINEFLFTPSRNLRSFKNKSELDDILNSLSKICDLE